MIFVSPKTPVMAVGFGNSLYVGTILPKIENHARCKDHELMVVIAPKSAAEQGPREEGTELAGVGEILRCPQAALGPADIPSFKGYSLGKSQVGRRRGMRANAGTEDIVRPRGDQDGSIEASSSTSGMEI